MGGAGDQPPGRRAPAVDSRSDEVSRRLVENRGFNASAAGWSLKNPNTNWALYTSGQYEGSGHLATNTYGPGGSVYQDIPYAIASGQSSCASAEVEATGPTGRR